jgi:RHS repeat-associated protein
MSGRRLGEVTRVSGLRGRRLVLAIATLGFAALSAGSGLAAGGDTGATAVQISPGSPRSDEAHPYGPPPLSETTRQRTKPPATDAPHAEAERERSQTAYLNTDSADSETLMQNTFADEFPLVAEDPTQIPDPAKVEGYIGDRAARIDPPGPKRPYVLTSNYPLRVKDDSGKLKPLDFELQREGNSYAPANTAQDVALPADPSGSLRLPDVGVGIKLQSPPTQQAKTEVVKDDDGENKKLFAHEVAPDTDALVTPSLNGIEQLLQLRGPDAPTTFTYAVSMQPQDQLRQAGEGELQVFRDDKPVAKITAPTAVDAQGNDVPVTLKPTAGGFEVLVDYHSQDVAWPLLVDPGFDYVSTPSNFGYGWWYIETSPGAPYTAASCAYYCWGSGFYMGVAGGYFVGASSWAQYHLVPPGGTTYIDEAFFENLNFARGGDNAWETPYLYTGLWEPGAGWGDSIQTVGHGVTGGSNDAWSPGTEARNGAYIGMANTASRTLPSARGGDVGVVHLHLEDPDSPSVGQPSAPTGWLSSTQPFNVTVPASDPGLGVVAGFVYAPDDQAGEKQFGAFASGCGTSPAGQVCPPSAAPQVSVDPTHIPDGIQTLDATGVDAGGTETGGASASDPNTAGHTSVKLDREGPKVNLSGPLYSARDADIGQSSYSMNIAATDGTTDPSGPPQTHRSGVKNIKVYVDDQQQFATPDLSCPQDSCPLELDVDPNTSGIQDWTLNAAQLAGGVHTVKVVATDQVGNTTTKTLDITVNGLAGVIITPKSGDSTARLFGLTAERHDPSMTDVTFQFRRAGTSSWQAIPATQLTLDSDGSHPASTLLHLDQTGKSPPVTWDVPPTPGIDGIDGQVNIRARFSSGTPQGQAGDNAALFWRLGESDTATAADSSGNDRSGTYMGNPLLNQHGAPIGSADDGAVDLNGSSQYISSKYTTRRNLVSNPSFESDTGWWAPWGSPSVWTRTTNQAQVGQASLKVNAAPGYNGTWYSSPATAGKYYSAAVQLRSGSGGQLGFHLCYVNSSGQGLRCDAVSLNPGSRWNQAVLNGSSYGAAPAGTANIWLFVNNESITQDFYVDAVQLEEGQTAGPYFDGSTPGDQWEGTPNDSVSKELGPFLNGASRTFTGWANRDRQDKLDALFGGKTSDQSAPQLILGGSGALPAASVKFSPAGNSGSSVTWDNAWPGSGQWVHWALKFNEPADTAELFINGQSKGVKSLTTQWATNPGPLLLGAWGGNDGAWTIFDFDGKLDEFAVYEGALSPSDISGLYTNGPQKGFSQVVPVTLSRDDTTSKHASAPVGPGSVDLMTGNFSVGSDDVSVDSWSSDLTVSRTFNSRQPNSGPGPFGQGWIASDPVDAAGSDYISLTFQGGVAKLNESDGTTITFSKNAAGDYVAEPGYEDLKLEPSGSNYSVSDLDGNVTSLSQVQGSTDYKVVSVKSPGQPTATTYNWDTVNGQRVIRREIAAVPAGVSCSAYPSNLTSGCRALDFVYASSTTATGNGTNQAQWGDFSGQVKEIDFVYGGGGGGNQSVVAVAKYQYDSDGRLRSEWDPRITPALKTTYDYDSGGRLLHVNPPGLNGWTLAYRAPGVNDNSPGKGGRLASASQVTPNGTATTTVAYGIPLMGGSTPYQMGASSVSAWGQTDVPTDATAVFPADTTPSDPPSSSQLGLATIYYMNRNGDPVNVANPGGEISTTEYEEHRLPSRTLTAANRARVLADPSLTYKIDSQNIYGADGQELRETYGPLHQIQLADGTNVNARQHTVTTYDEGAPALQHPHLPTTTVTGARVDGENSDRDPQTTTEAYDWKLGQPTATTTDPNGLRLITKSTYDDSTGLQTQDRSPNANAGGTDAHTTNTIYYTAGSNSQDSTCGSKPQWANLPCKVAPAGQPGGSLPSLPTTKYESYNIWDQPMTVTETVPGGSGVQRTSTTTYDGAGRAVTKNISATGSNTGTPLPTTTYGYDSTTGLPTTVSDGTRTVTKQYDSIGRLAYYTDADSNTSATNYDILDRPTSFNDGKGTTTYAYDSTTRRLSSESDGGVGQITASYDADGNVTSETMPAGLNKLVMTMSYDPAGNATQKSYDLCTLGNCSLSPTNRYLDAISLSTHDQVQQETTTFDSSTYGYDSAGRLTKAAETAGSQCTTQRYSYDPDSNRTQLDTNASLGAGFCTPTGSSQTSQHAYDDADRTTNAGFSYDSFGRTLTVPAADAGGSQLTSTYYVDDRSRSLSQAGVTQTFNLDPAERVRLQSKTGQADQKFHYADDSDNPAWIDLGGTQSNWERFVPDPAGELCATQTGHGSTSDGFTYQLTDLHGDVAMTVNSDGSVTGSFSTDAFGTPEGPVPADGHGWLGGKGRMTELASGVVGMGQRVYVPQLGRFLQTDPVAGGSANDYDYVNQDPVNQIDPMGTISLKSVTKFVRKIAHVIGRAVRKVFGSIGRFVRKFARVAGAATRLAHKYLSGISPPSFGQMFAGVKNGLAAVGKTGASLAAGAAKYEWNTARKSWSSLPTACQTAQLQVAVGAIMTGAGVYFKNAGWITYGGRLATGGEASREVNC